MALESDLATKVLDDECLNLPQVEMQEDERDHLFFSEMAWSNSVNMALKTTIELGVFDIIAKAGEGAKLSAKEIADQIGTNNPEAPTMLDRVLGLLACHSFLSCVVEDPQNIKLHQRLYSLSPSSKYFVNDDADGVSVGPVFLLSLDKVFYQSWSELKGTILEGGKPFNRAHGMQLFDYTKIDARFNQVFNKGMHNISIITMKRILDIYQGFEHINKLVDVGGNDGTTMKLITSKHPHIRGINFDLPHVIELAPAHPGLEHFRGDMFESVPNGDAIFMKYILHDWDDEDCLKILKNCHKAIPNDGKVIVVDNILPVVPEPTAIAKKAFRIDLSMLTQTLRGKERTKQEFMDLAKRSGFTSIKFACYVNSIWVMEFYK
ncbi:hypothetical protein PIB30_009183 [Stylosanthes scabra]|uniref:Uncharacterized protein n=1 Tax=Stylosanthes scabra TaxID=79078 RepID=A0ABU6Y358_9FABA|nr:hypothetical protein [Stylosanthes scabra]